MDDHTVSEIERLMDKRKLLGPCLPERRLETRERPQARQPPRWPAVAFDGC
jgi:hypothetical protein